jgi:hypothetical protein
MPAGNLTPEALVDFVSRALLRATGVYGTRPTDDPQHALALGEAVALFNLVDEFGLMADVRQQVDQQAGKDVYRGLSEAMKRFYLGGASVPAAGRPDLTRPAAPSATRPASGPAGRPGGGGPRGARPGGPPPGGRGRPPVPPASPRPPARKAPSN